MYRVYEPVVAPQQLDYVTDCVRNNELSWRGRTVSRFEEKLGEALRAKHVITTANGTVSLFAAYKTLFEQRYGYVVVPAMTYAATVSQVILSGFQPLYIDCDQNFQATPAGVETALNSVPLSVVAGVVIPTLYSDAPDLVAIRALCQSRGLPLVVDAAEAFCCQQGNREVGSYGDVASYSFFANKVITTGEGGCLTTDNDEVAERLRRFCNQGTKGGYWHDGVGSNFRMAALPAAVGLAQLEELDNIIARKREIARFYRAELAYEPVVPRGVSSSSEWMPLFRLPGPSYEEFRLHCDGQGVEVRPCFTPINRMPGFKGGLLKTPVADFLVDRHFILPCHPGLSDDDLEQIVGIANSFLETR